MAAKTILYATDYSEPSQQALGFATSLARDRHDEQVGQTLERISEAARPR